MWLIVHPKATDRVRVDQLEGVAYVNGPRTAIGLNDGSRFVGGFDISGAVGRECIPPPTPPPTSVSIRLRIGVIHYAPTATQSGGDAVVWVEMPGPADLPLTSGAQPPRAVN
jgi:hypothetical protein